MTWLVLERHNLTDCTKIYYKTLAKHKYTIQHTDPIAGALGTLLLTWILMGPSEFMWAIPYQIVGDAIRVLFIGGSNLLLVVKFSSYASTSSH